MLNKYHLVLLPEHCAVIIYIFKFFLSPHKPKVSIASISQIERLREVIKLAECQSADFKVDAN